MMRTPVRGTVISTVSSLEAEPQRSPTTNSVRVLLRELRSTLLTVASKVLGRAGQSALTDGTSTRRNARVSRCSLMHSIETKATMILRMAAVASHIPTSVARMICRWTCSIEMRYSSAFGHFSSLAKRASHGRKNFFRARPLGGAVVDRAWRTDPTTKAPVARTSRMTVATPRSRVTNGNATRVGLIARAAASAPAAAAVRAATDLERARYLSVVAISLDRSSSSPPSAIDGCYRTPSTRAKRRDRRAQLAVRNPVSVQASDYRWPVGITCGAESCPSKEVNVGGCATTGSAWDPAARLTCSGARRDLLGPVSTAPWRHLCAWHAAVGVDVSSRCALGRALVSTNRGGRSVREGWGVRHPRSYARRRELRSG